MSDQASLQHAIQVLKDAIPDAKVTRKDVARSPGEMPDLVIKVNDTLLVAEVKALRSTRILDLEGRLAVATLAAQRLAQERKTAAPVVMIQLPKLGPKSLAFAQEFMAREAPALAWCLFDAEGAYRLEIPQLKIAKSARPRSPSRLRSSPARGALFSDLNRWMLKILLMHDVPKPLWGGPNQSVQSVRELQRVASVSQQTAYSFFRTFEAAGYVRETPHGIMVVRRDELIQTWLRHEVAFHTDSIPVRSIFGAAQDLSAVLLRSEAPAQFAVTGFEACRLLGVLHAPVPQREVCLAGSVEAAIQSWQLHPCEPRDADLLLSRMAYPKSILRGRTMKDQLPVVDVLEASLDVFKKAPRGTEQAEYIFEHVLQWNDCL